MDVRLRQEASSMSTAKARNLVDMSLLSAAPFLRFRHG